MKLLAITNLILLLTLKTLQAAKPKDDLNPNADEIKEDIENFLDTPDFEEEKIANRVQQACYGDCIDIPMDLPSDNYWSNQKPILGWSPSHGHPSVSPNNIWMWSYNNLGEGVNLEYKFI